MKIKISKKLSFMLLPGLGLATLFSVFSILCLNLKLQNIPKECRFQKFNTNTRNKLNYLDSTKNRKMCTLKIKHKKLLSIYKHLSKNSSSRSKRVKLNSTMQIGYTAFKLGSKVETSFLNCILLIR